MSSLTVAQLEATIEEAKDRCRVLEAHIAFLLRTYNLYDADGEFTFPDGETFDMRDDSAYTLPQSSTVE